MVRHLIAALALGGLTLGGALAIFSSSGTHWHSLGDSSLRVGLLFGVLWLAAPDLQRLPLWVVGLVVVAFAAVVFVARRPIYMIPIMGAIFLALYVLRPPAFRKRSPPP